MDYRTIGKQIRRRREEQGLTQEKLAERAGLSPSYMGVVERGDKVPSLETFIRISNALEVSADRLLSGVLTVGNQVAASELYEMMMDLPKSEQRRILHVVQTMIADSQTAEHTGETAY